MKPYAFHILRVGIAITFMWIGILILKEPDAWSGLVEDWVKGLIPFDLQTIMIETAILDFVVGLFLLLNKSVLAASLLGSLHVLSVLIATGITIITVRDIAILAGTLALAFENYPKGFKPEGFKDYLNLTKY